MNIKYMNKKYSCGSPHEYSLYLADEDDFDYDTGFFLS